MTVIDKRHADEAHRLRLRVVAKAMLGVAFLGVVFVFLSAFLSINRESESGPGMRIDLAGFEPGQTEVYTWERRPVIVQRRTPETVIRLRETSGFALLDPESARSEQPEDAGNALRSSNPGWFVALGLGTGQGCPVRALPADPGESFAGGPWAGGFVEECTGSRYDAAGRVYDDQYADRNLIVPAYTISGDTLILGR